MCLSLALSILPPAAPYHVRHFTPPEGTPHLAAASFGSDDHRDRLAFLELGDALGCGLLNKSAVRYARKQQRGKNPTHDFLLMRPFTACRV